MAIVATVVDSVTATIQISENFSERNRKRFNLLSFEERAKTIACILQYRIDHSKKEAKNFDATDAILSTGNRRSDMIVQYLNEKSEKNFCGNKQHARNSRCNRIGNKQARRHEAEEGERGG